MKEDRDLAEALENFFKAREFNILNIQIAPKYVKVSGILNNGTPFEASGGDIKFLFSLLP